MASLSDYRVFFREFRRNFHTTGAIVPSGRWLCAALARYVRDDHRPKRVLEVGPGTGAVTAQIVRALGEQDRLDLVELNDEFVRRLTERFATEPAFRAVASRTSILHQRVEQLSGERQYDAIISGLPLNNFAVAEVETILDVCLRQLKPGGTFSFFEYIGVRPLRGLISRRMERQRLRGVSEAIRRVVQPHAIRRDWIIPNIPPAWVHHVRPSDNGGRA